ncbi:MAG: potassium channel family protein [Paracoccaceae bacterium]
MIGEFRKTVRLLYLGRSRGAVRFRYALIVFDVGTIVFFIATMPFELSPALLAANTAIGLAILVDLAARFWIEERPWRLLGRLYVLADLVVVAALLLAPFLSEEIAFLRILRGLRLMHAYHVLHDLRRDSGFFRRNEETVLALVNLVVFVFVTTSVVFVMFFEDQAGPEAYLDALYFTVTTLTTTGFGDITPDTPFDKMLSVFIMVAGVTLFVRLARAVFQPARVRHKCPDCGLLRHDADAIHCKHCGRPLRIETEGAG